MCTKRHKTPFVGVASAAAHQRHCTCKGRPLRWKLHKFARDQAVQYPCGSFWTFSHCQFTGFNTPDSPRSSGRPSFLCIFFVILHFIFYNLHMFHIFFFHLFCMSFHNFSHVFLRADHCSCPEPGQQQLSRGTIAPGLVKFKEWCMKSSFEHIKIQVNRNQKSPSSPLTLVSDESLWSWL